MRLSDLEVGEHAKVISLSVDEKIKMRLLKMGMTEGVKVTLVRISPFLDPIEISVRGIDIALRRQDANCIMVERI